VSEPTSAERSQRARIAALANLAQSGGTRVSAPARAAFLRRFEDEVDPTRSLPEAERAERAEYARRRYFAALALRSARARARRAERDTGAPKDPDATHVTSPTTTRGGRRASA
jgi:hypothetical protein